MDAENWDETASQIILEHGGEIFAQGADDLIELAIPEEDLAKRDSELVACEVECRRAGRDVFFVELDIDGLDAEGGVHL